MDKFEIGQVYEYKSRHNHIIYEIISVNICAKELNEKYSDANYSTDRPLIQYKPLQCYYTDDDTLCYFSLESSMALTSVHKPEYETKLWKIMND